MIAVLVQIVGWLRRWGAVVAGGVVAVYLVLRRWGGAISTPSAAQKKVEEKTAEATKKAEAVAVVEKAEAESAHEQGLVTELSVEKTKTDAVEGKPDQVSDYLREAGEAARRDGK